MAVSWRGGLVPIGALLRVATLQMSPQSLRRPQVFVPRWRQSRRAILRAPCWRESLVVATHGRHNHSTCLGEKRLGKHIVMDITRNASPHPHKTMQIVRKMVLLVGA